MKPTRYSPLAQRDSIHHSSWLIEHGLTRDAPYILLNEVDDIVDRIAQTPTIFKPYATKRGKVIRVSHPTSTHSFRVAYSELEQEILIIALIHPSRRPNYWINRKF